MKTYKQWSNSKLSLTKFFKVGDVVDEELVEYFVEVLPPAHCSFEPGAGLVQIGEVYDHTPDAQQLYLTVAQVDNEWKYAGICLRGERQAWEEKTDE